MAKRRDPQLRNIERRCHQRRDGSVLVVFRVRWVDEDGERQKETFDTLEAAIAFRDELEARTARLLEGPASRAHTTVADAKEQWWNAHVRPRLARRTQDNYAGAWRRHIEHRVDGLLLIDLTTAEIERLKDEMLGAAIGPPTVRTAIALLGSILRFAARRNMVDFNAASAVEKPPSRKQRARRMPPSIEIIERMRQSAINRYESPLTAIWISIGAYAGLRPGEIRGLLWSHIHQRTIWVSDTPDPDGEPTGETKTHRDRPAELHGGLAEDLWAWRAITPFATDSDPVIPTATGTAMTDNDYKNFVRRKFKPAVQDAGWECVPYDLRHFNASLLIKEGRLSLREVADHLGHTLVELSRTYAHEISEYRGRQVDVQAELARVRARLHGTDPLRQIALDFGAPAEDCPTREPEATAPPPVAIGALESLVNLNVMGVLSDDELASKVRLLVTT